MCEVQGGGGKPRGQLEQRVECAPALTLVLATEKTARLGARIYGPIRCAHRKREHGRLRQLAVAPGSAAGDAAAHTALTQTDEYRVGVGRVDGEALRAASRQGELDRPRFARLVESGEAVAGCGVEARHLG
jgi:hypothetical protein